MTEPPVGAASEKRRPAFSDDLPDLDSLLIEGQRRLADIEPKLPCRFTFSVYGIAFKAMIERRGDAVRLRFVGDLGQLPFSAEDPATRSRLIRLVGWGEPSRRLHFARGLRNRIAVVGEIEIAEPISGEAIVFAMVSYLLDARAYFQVATEQRMGRRADAP